jgi:methyl-accepting chemotaxis protein
MHWLRCLPVARKFVYAFGIVCALCVALGTYTFIAFRGITTKTAQVSESSLPAVINLANIRGAINTMRREDLHLLLCATPKCVADEGPKRQKAIDNYHAAAKAYEPLTFPENYLGL